MNGFWLNVSIEMEIIMEMDLNTVPCNYLLETPLMTLQADSDYLKKDASKTPMLQLRRLI